MSKQVFFCGAVLTHDGLKHYRGETPAASIWLRGLFTGLLANDVNITCFSPVWDSLFPKGRLFPGQLKYLDNFVSHVLVRYINLPLIRSYSVAFSLERALIKAVKNGNQPIAILNYNTYPYYVMALKKVSKKFPHIPWVNVVLDLDDPTTDNWNVFLEDTNGSSGSVFLSWWGYQNAPIKNKHHMDGGWIGELKIKSRATEKIFLYAGKYAKFGGIDDIIEAIQLFKEEDVVFEFYGKDKYQPLTNLAKMDSRVHIMGFVSDEELDSACQRAFAFLSPREFNFQGTRMIYPSKIIFYLKYQKPIISAMLPGLSPDYEHILISPQDNLPKQWALTMLNVLQFSDYELDSIAKSSRNLLVNKKWKHQAALLLAFIESI